MSNQYFIFKSIEDTEVNREGFKRIEETFTCYIERVTADLTKSFLTKFIVLTII